MKTGPDERSTIECGKGAPIAAVPRQERARRRSCRRESHSVCPLPMLHLFITYVRRRASGGLNSPRRGQSIPNPNQNEYAQ